MSAAASVSRRRFLYVVPAAGAGLVLGVHLAGTGGAGSSEAPSPKKGDASGGFAPNAFLRIDPSGDVTIWATNSEMGQGPMTTLAMIVADELEADWARVRVEQAHLDPKFGSLDTGGSGTVHEKFTPMRQAGAAARAMLMAAAAQRWGVEVSSCRADRGAVVHPGTGRRLLYGELADAASRLPVPSEPPLKDPKEFRLIGTRAPRVDNPEKVTGRAVYGIDVKVPGMLYAAVARCPVFGGKAAGFDAAKAKAVAGVRDVVAVESGVAVVADSTWAALKGRDALAVRWDEGPAAAESTERLRATMEELSRSPGRTVRSDGDADAALTVAARKIEAVYELPFQAHATMEPQNATAHVTADECRIWAPTQFPGWASGEVRRLTGLPAEKIRLEVTMLGGGFGRRINPDFVVEAVAISKAAGAPVKTVWTRDDDLQHDFYRPASLHRLEASLDATGRIVSWKHRIVSTSIEDHYQPGTQKPEDSEVGGAVDLPYAIPNVRVEYALARSAVPRGWWRSVESSFNAFAVECFLDELAAAGRRDPLHVRRDLLREPRRIPSPGGESVLDTARLLAVLELAAARAGWGGAMPAGRGRGLAVHYSYRTYCAQVAEVSVERGRLRVQRVVCALDCGRVVNPEIVAQQVEGSVVFALTAALKSGITIERGRVAQTNFDDYEMLRLDEAPEVEVHLVPSDAAPTGVGEPAVPVAAPAVFNAIAAACGRRVRRLPVRAGDLGVG